MTPRFGRPTAFVPPSTADGATPEAVEALDAFLELSPLDTLAADAARHASVEPSASGRAAVTSDAADPEPASPTPAHTTALADGLSSRHQSAPAGDPAPNARFQGTPRQGQTDRAEGRITHHLRRDR